MRPAHGKSNRSHALVVGDPCGGRRYPTAHADTPHLRRRPPEAVLSYSRSRNTSDSDAATTRSRDFTGENVVCRCEGARTLLHGRVGRRRASRIVVQPRNKGTVAAILYS